MGVVVFDSDVLIGFLNRDDGHHDAAVELMREAMIPRMQRWICSVNYAEILIGPMRIGKQDLVMEMLARFNIETRQVDIALTERAATVRHRTNLKLPDAFAVATAVDAANRGHDDVSLATFDKKVLKAYAGLR